MNLFARIQLRRSRLVALTRDCALGASLVAAALVGVSSRLAAQWRTTVLPVVGSAPETGWQLGAALFRTLEPADPAVTRPSSLIGNAVFTAEGQQRAFLEYDRWTEGNERRSRATAIVSRFPLPYWGRGTRDFRLEEPMDYEPFTIDLGFTRQRKIGAATWRSIGVRVVDVHVEESYAAIDLTCDVLGPTCPLPTDPLADYALPLQGYPYRMLTATVGAVLDTRDGLFAPSRGKLLDVSLGASGVYAYETLEPLLHLRVDARGYRPLRRGGVFGAQAVVQGNDGSVPIDQLALVGHHSLNRGYTMGEYRDHWMVAGQVEWRGADRWWNQRLGVAAFAGAAMLGETISALPRSELLPSGGAGIRFRLDRTSRSAIRVDYAVGARGQSGLYVAFNEAF